MNAAFRPFTEHRVEAVLEQFAKKIPAAVEALAAEHIAHRNEDELADELVKRFVLTVPSVDFAAKHFEKTTVEVRAERNPSLHGLVAGKVYTKAGCRIHLPYVGDAIFLRCYDFSRHLTGHHQFWLNGNELTFEVFDFELTADFVEAECAMQFRFLSVHLGVVAAAVHAYNAGLPRRVRHAISARKQQFVAKSMTPSAAGRLADVLLDPRVYGEILDALATEARALQRKPNAPAIRGEADIRARVLEGLRITFEESAGTGESFIAADDTDILLRHDERSLFRARFQIWNGQAEYLEAITGLLGHCTARECKMALLIFVHATERAAAEVAIKAAAPSHPGFVREDVPYIGGVVRYTFETPGSSKHAKVAVLLFQLPKQGALKSSSIGSS